MRMRSVAVMVAALWVTSLLVPAGAWAKRVTAGGSIEISGTSVNPTNQLVVTLITANPGLEKTIVQQLPLPGPIFIAPFFVNEEQGNPGQGDIGTTLLLTNTTASLLSITLTVYNLDGTVAATVTPSPLNPHETRVIAVSDLLP